MSGSEGRIIDFDVPISTGASQDGSGQQPSHLQQESVVDDEEEVGHHPSDGAVDAVATGDAGTHAAPPQPPITQQPRGSQSATVYRRLESPSERQQQQQQQQRGPNVGNRDVAPVELLSPDPCMRSVIRCFPSLFTVPEDEEPSCFQKVIGRIFVTPLTNVTPFSLDYQLYLDLIFHRGLTARLGHYVCMPFVVFTQFVFLAQFTGSVFPDGEQKPTQVGGIPSGAFLNGALLYAILLSAWYFVWGIYALQPMLALMMFLPNFVFYVVATLCYYVLREPDPDVREWYQPMHHAALNPLMWQFIMALLQSMSHALEPDLPPRVSGTPHWIGVRRFLRENTCKFALVACSQIIFGMVDEWLASPRLLPLFWLKNVYWMGYEPLYWNTIRAIANYCIATGDPALDFVGVGGGTYLDPDGTLTVTDPETGKRQEVHQRSTSDAGRGNGGDGNEGRVGGIGWYTTTPGGEQRVSPSLEHQLDRMQEMRRELQVLNNRLERAWQRAHAAHPDRVPNFFSTCCCRGSNCDLVDTICGKSHAISPSAARLHFLLKQVLGAVQDSRARDQARWHRDGHPIGLYSTPRTGMPVVAQASRRNLRRAAPASTTYGTTVTRAGAGRRAPSAHAAAAAAADDDDDDEEAAIMFLGEENRSSLSYLADGFTVMRRAELPSQRRNMLDGHELFFQESDRQHFDIDRTYNRSFFVGMYNG